MEKSLAVWVRAALFVVAGICFYTFRSVEEQASLHTESSVQSLLRREAETSNSYALAKSISDLENLGIISCIKMTELNPIRRVFYNSSQVSHCKSIFYYTPPVTKELTSLNGALVLLEYSQPRNWPLLLSEILIYFFITVFAMILPRFIFSVFKEKNLRLINLENQNESIFNLARQVSHDVASPISVLQLIADRVKKSDPEIEEVLNATLDRTKTIFNHLRQGSAHPEFFTLNIMIEKMVQEKMIEWGKNVLFTIDLKNTENAAIFGEPTNFQQLLSNILNNSYEATRNIYDPIIQISTQILSQDQLSIQITDNGHGIPEEHLKNLGTKGYSYGKTHIAGSGLGLGLYHAKTHLEKWGGLFEIKSSQQIHKSFTQVKMTYQMSLRLSSAQV